MSNNKIKIALSLTAVVVVILGYFLFTQVIKPDTIIKDDVAATQDLFKHIDEHMTWNLDNVYMTLEPTGYVNIFNTVVTTVGLQRPEFPSLNADTINYYRDNYRSPGSVPFNVKPEYADRFKPEKSQISMSYFINFDQSKVDNVYLVRKIDHEDYFSFNAHATLSHIIFNLNKQQNIKPSTSLRLELTPIKMKNGEAYHYFAKESDINTPVAYDTCKDTLDCLYISRYKSTVPRPL
jgi:hypothetical protein